MTGEFARFVCQVAPFNQDKHKIREIEHFGQVRIAPYTNDAYISIQKTFINITSCTYQ